MPQKAKPNEEEILKRLEAGESTRTLAKEFGVSPMTISRVKQKVKSVKPTGEVSKRISEEVVERSLYDVEEVLKIGKFVRDDYKKLATAHGMDLEDFIEEVVEFWNVHKAGIKDVEAEKDFYKALAARLLRLASPSVKRILQSKVLERIITTQIMAGQPVDEGMVLRLLENVWSD